MQGLAYDVDAKILKKDRLDVFELKSITKKRRHEFVPQLATTLNDPFVQTIAIGLRYAYHINEGMAFELSGAFAYSTKSGLVDQLRQSGENSLLRPTSGDPPTAEFNPSIVLPKVYASGSLVWSPLVGKFAMGREVVDMNVYLVAGVGYVMTNYANRLLHLPALNFGIGWRTFLSKWLCLNIEVRDMIFSQEIKGVNVLLHSVFFNVGFGLMLPTLPNYG